MIFPDQLDASMMSADGTMGWRMRDQVQVGLLGLLPRLRRFAIALTGSVTDGEELVQGACERVLDRAGQVRDLTRVDAWIYGVMRNLWVDELRSRRVRRHDELSAAADVIGDDGVATAEGRLNLAAVRRALAELPEDQRTVLVLVCVDGLSYKEAANVLGIPIGTVMSRLSRGRQDLHERLNNRPVSDKRANDDQRGATIAMLPNTIRGPWPMNPSMPGPGSEATPPRPDCDPSSTGR